MTAVSRPGTGKGSSGKRVDRGFARLAEFPSLSAFGTSKIAEKWRPAGAESTCCRRQQHI